MYDLVTTIIEPRRKCIKTNFEFHNIKKSFENCWKLLKCSEKWLLKIFKFQIEFAPPMLSLSSFICQQTKAGTKCQNSKIGRHFSIRKWQRQHRLFQLWAWLIQFLQLIQVSGALKNSPFCLRIELSQLCIWWVLPFSPFSNWKCNIEKLWLIFQIPGMLEAKTINLDTILPVCVKFCASHNSSVKKSSCEALICCSERYSRPDVGLLAVNILMKDLKDPNPDVRATAVDTIASLSLIVDEHSLPGNLSTKSNFF